MPHCTLECSDNILERPDKKALLSTLNNRLAGTGLFSLDDIKSRIVIHNDFVIGDGDAARAFVTLNVAILSGRDDETKKMLSKICLDLLSEHFRESFEKLKLSLTVQISELDKNSYERNKSY